MNRAAWCWGPGLNPLTASFPTCFSHISGVAGPGGRLSAKSQPPKHLHLDTWQASILRSATQGSLFALSMEILHSWPLAPPSVCCQLPHYFKFCNWLLEYLKTQGFHSPSIHLFLVQGISIAIFISWPVTRPSVLYLEILLPCFKSSLENRAHLLRHLWCWDTLLQAKLKALFVYCDQMTRTHLHWVHILCQLLC